MIVENQFECQYTSFFNQCYFNNRTSNCLLPILILLTRKLRASTEQYVYNFQIQNKYQLKVMTINDK
jgi:hypothetical protein